VRVLGVQPADADAMAQSLRAGHRVRREHVGLFADGVATREPGELTFALCQRYLDGCITVGVDEVCAAIRDAFEDTRSVLEPAGALSLAGVKRALHDGQLAEGTGVAVASGGHMHFPPPGP